MIIGAAVGVAATIRRQGDDDVAEYPRAEAEGPVAQIRIAFGRTPGFGELRRSFRRDLQKQRPVLGERERTIIRAGRDCGEQC